MTSGYPDWTRAVLLVGDAAGTKIPVAVDSDGRLYALLQGEYEGGLRTIALDADGRISAFIIDSVDAWGQMLTVGNAELAARLNSPVTLQRSGNVLHATNFNDGLGGYRPTIRAGNLSIHTDYLYSTQGGYSVAISPVGGPGAIGGITQKISGEWHTRVGFAVLFLVLNTHNKFLLEIDYDDGETRKRGKVVYDGDKQQLLVKVNEDATTPVTGEGEARLMGEAWCLFKLIVDTTTQKYVSCIFNQSTYDLTPYNLYTIASSYQTGLVVSALHEQVSTLISSVYIDRAIITVSEM